MNKLFDAKTNRKTAVWCGDGKVVDVPYPPPAEVEVYMENVTYGAVKVAVNGEDCFGMMPKAHYDRV